VLQIGGSAFEFRQTATSDSLRGLLKDLFDASQFSRKRASDSRRLRPPNADAVLLHRQGDIQQRTPPADGERLFGAGDVGLHQLGDLPVKQPTA